MKLKILALTLALATATAVHGQSAPTATQTSAISVFAGGTGTFTGLDSGKNLGITAGLDIRLHKFVGIDPSIEIRGTYPVHDGLIDAEKNVLAGIKLEKAIFVRFHPYLDVLYGRGEIDYEGSGYPSLNGRYYYVQSPTNVFSPGAGLDLDLSRHFAVKADAQLQRYETPVTTSGTLYSKALTLGIVYRFTFGDRRR